MALVRDPHARAEIERAVGDRRCIRICVTPEHLKYRLRAERPTALIVELGGSQSEETLAVVREAKAQYRWVPVLGFFCDLAASSAREILSAAQVGVTDLVIRPYNDLREAVHSLLGRTSVEVARRHALPALKGMLPEEFHALAEYCVRHAHTVPTLDEVAASIGTAPRTLLRRLSRAELPPAGALLAWSRVLIASYLMQDLSWRTAAVAHELGFATPLTLRGALKRLLGMTPSDIRQPGGLSRALHRVREGIGGRPAAERAPLRVPYRLEATAASAPGTEAPVS